MKSHVHFENNELTNLEDESITNGKTNDAISNSSTTVYRQSETEFFAKLEKLRKEHYSVFGKKLTCVNIWWFVVLYFCIIMLRTCIGSYLYTVSHEIWKRYYITKFEMEFVVGVEKIGLVVTLILSSFYGNKFFKPISILSGAILCGLGSILCSIPYFIHGERLTDQQSTVPSYIQAGLCLTSASSTNLTFTDQCSEHPAASTPAENKVGCFFKSI